MIDWHCMSLSRTNEGLEQVEQLDNIPFGYKFCPTAVEAILMLLLPRIMGTDHPSAYVADLDVYSFDPDQLPLGGLKHAREDEGYFFTPEKGIFEGRCTPGGYWKVEDLKDNVAVYRYGETIGFKTKLSFYRDGMKTDWKMTEYMSNITNSEIKLVRYMICKVWLKPKEVWIEVKDYDDDGVLDEENNLVTS